MSSLRPPSRDAGHDLLVEEQEQHDQRHRDDHDRGHHGGDVLAAEAVLADLLDAVGDEEIVGVVGDEAGPDVAVPALDHLEDGDGDHRRAADGQQHAQEILEVGGPYTANEVVLYMLKRHNILTRDCSNKPGLDSKQYMRIAIRNHEDNTRLVDGLKQFKK